jgi:hypothetical protein
LSSLYSWGLYFSIAWAGVHWDLLKYRNQRCTLPGVNNISPTSGLYVYKESGIEIGVHNKFCNLKLLKKFYFGTPVGRKKFYGAGEALREGGLKFLELFGYFLFQDKK